MKMRELEARTGVNRETIRVLFRHGLLPEPVRGARNVADYDETHVRSILMVRDLQKDSGLTLPQIKAMLNGQSAERRVEAGALQHLEQLVANRVGYEHGTMSIATLAQKYPHAEHDAAVFASINLVTIMDGRDGPQLSLTDARLVEIWGQMREAGFMEGTGFPPEILAYYRDASEYVAANEARLFLERTEGRITADEGAAMLQIALPQMLDFFGVLRLKAFMRNIHDATHSGKPVPVVPSPLANKGRKRKGDA